MFGNINNIVSKNVPNEKVKYFSKGAKKVQAQLRESTGRDVKIFMLNKENNNIDKDLDLATMKHFNLKVRPAYDSQLVMYEKLPSKKQTLRHWYDSKYGNNAFKIKVDEILNKFNYDIHEACVKRSKFISNENKINMIHLRERIDDRYSVCYWFDIKGAYFQFIKVPFTNKDKATKKKFGYLIKIYLIMKYSNIISNSILIEVIME